MSGELLREAKHQCAPPYDDLGAVWRCDCGRRWVCVLDYTASPDGRAWKRRLLNRLRRHPARLVSDLCYVEITDDQFTIRASNRTVVYRIGEYDPQHQRYLCHWPD